MNKKHLMKKAALAAACICMAAGFSFPAFASENNWDYDTYRDEDGNICIEFEEVIVTLPPNWVGICQMTPHEDYIEFSHILSRELWTEELGYTNGGTLFSICKGDDYSYVNLPSYKGIGVGDDGYIYYATFPTDVQGYTEDDQAMNEFQLLMADMEFVQDNLAMKNGSVITDAAIGDAEYILPYSSDTYLTESDLDGMTADEIQMAINEIYARHHRLFVLPQVQSYFDSKSWYDGYISAKDFDVSVMNTYEGTNIGLMIRIMNSRKTSSDTLVP